MTLIYLLLVYIQSQCLTGIVFVVEEKLLYISPVQLSLIDKKKSVKPFVVLASIDIIIFENKSKQIHLQKQQCQLTIGSQMALVVEQVIRSRLFGSFFFTLVISTKNGPDHGEQII